MPDLLSWYVGDREPPISQIVTVDGVVQNLTGKIAKFKMRAVGSSVLKVDAAVSNTLDATGLLTYEWGSTDTNTAAQYLAWWEVTTGGKIQPVGEAVIEVRAHAPLTNGYVELEQAKSTLGLSSTTYADLDVQAAIVGASRMIDNRCGRRFWKDTVDATRYFTPSSSGLVFIDDLAAVPTSVSSDDGYAGTWANAWTENTDYRFAPDNAVILGHPFTRIVRHETGRYSLSDDARSVRVVGRFGWPAVPAEITLATTILTGRFLKRARDAQLGIVGLGLDGAAVRVSRLDPDVEALIQPYVRYTVA